MWDRGRGTGDVGHKAWDRCLGRRRDTGDVRLETWNRISETGDGDWREEIGDMRRETGEVDRRRKTKKEQFCGLSISRKFSRKLFASVISVYEQTWKFRILRSAIFLSQLDAGILYTIQCTTSDLFSEIIFPVSWDYPLKRYEQQFRETIPFNGYMNIRLSRPVKERAFVILVPIVPYSSYYRRVLLALSTAFRFTVVLVIALCWFIRGLYK